MNLSRETSIGTRRHSNGLAPAPAPTPRIHLTAIKYLVVPARSHAVLLPPPPKLHNKRDTRWQEYKEYKYIEDIIMFEFIFYQRRVTKLPGF